MEATFPLIGSNLSAQWKECLQCPQLYPLPFNLIFNLKSIIFHHFATKTKGISAVVANKRARHHKTERKTTKYLEHHHFAPYLCIVERNKNLPGDKKELNH